MKKSINLFFLLLAMFLWSCSDDDGNNGGTSTTDSKVYVMCYNDFLDPSDVLITAQDTSVITVSKPYATTKGLTMKKGDKIVVWRSVNELPFCKTVENANYDNNNRVVLNLSACTYDEIIPDGHFILSSDLYTDKNQPARTNDGSINEMHYVEKTDSGNVYHPAAIIINNDGKDNDGEAPHVATAVDSIPGTVSGIGTSGVLVEDLEKKNWGGSFSFTPVNINIALKDLTFKKQQTEKDSVFYMEIGAERLAFSALAGFNVEWKGEWFTLKEFSYGIKYELGASAKLKAVAGRAFKVPKEYGEMELATITSLSYIFWCGVIPVYVTTTPKICHGFKGGVDASLGFRQEFSYKYSGGTTSKWKKDIGWRDYKTKKEDRKVGDPEISLIGKLSLEYSVFLKCDVSLFGFISPKSTMGPYFKGEVTGTYGANLAEGKPIKEIKAKVSAGLKWGLGIDIKAGKWKLAGVTWDWPIVEAVIYENKWNFADEDNKAIEIPYAPAI